MAPPFHHPTQPRPLEGEEGEVEPTVKQQMAQRFGNEYVEELLGNENIRGKYIKGTCTLYIHVTVHVHVCTCTCTQQHDCEQHV